MVLSNSTLACRAVVGYLKRLMLASNRLCNTSFIIARQGKGFGDQGFRELSSGNSCAGTAEGRRLQVDGVLFGAML